MNTTDHQEFILVFEDSNKPTHKLGMTARIAGGMEYKPGFYLSEHDGLSMVELFGAVKHLFPEGTKAENNGRDQAWVSHWDDVALAEYAGKTYCVRSSLELDEDGDLVDQTFELLA
jgi:hypothetical protein